MLAFKEIIFEKVIGDKAMYLTWITLDDAHNIDPIYYDIPD